MTLKEIKQHYNVRKMEGYYDLSSKEVGGSRVVHKYICSIHKDGRYFRLGDRKPTAKIEVLLEQIKEYLAFLPYDSEYYCPSYREGTGQDWFLHDKLKEYGFKEGGWWEPSGYSLDRKSVYSFKVTNFTIDYTIFTNKEHGEQKINIYIHTRGYSFVKVEASFDFVDIHKTLDGLLKPLLLSEGVSNILLSEKMEMSNVDAVLLELKDLDVTTSKVGLKEKLLELAEQL